MKIEHTVRAFDADLQELAADIAEMGHLDDEQIAIAIEAVVGRDERLADRVVAGDDNIDDLQMKIEHKAVTTIARRQPMAVDLREIVAAFRVSIELERIGDLAENVAKRVRLLPSEIDIPSAMLSLQRMADLVRKQVANVLRSYADRSVEMVMGVWNKDLDGRQRQL
jgi:phosphate transport system protein